MTSRAKEKTTSPVFLPCFIFSLIADSKDNEIRNMAAKRNQPLCAGIQRPIVAVPRPKLARISEACQQKAKSVAERTAPILLKNLGMDSPFLSGSSHKRKAFRTWILAIIAAEGKVDLAMVDLAMARRAEAGGQNSVRPRPVNCPGGIDKTGQSSVRKQKDRERDYPLPVFFNRANLPARGLTVNLYLTTAVNSNCRLLPSASLVPTDNL